MSCYLQHHFLAEGLLCLVGDEFGSPLFSTLIRPQKHIVEDSGVKLMGHKRYARKAYPYHAWPPTLSLRAPLLCHNKHALGHTLPSALETRKIQVRLAHLVGVD